MHVARVVMSSMMVILVGKWDIMLEIATAVVERAAMMTLTEVSVRIVLVIETAHPVRICLWVMINAILLFSVRLFGGLVQL